MFKKGHTQNKGRKFTQEHKDKISKANIGKNISKETREKLSKALSGKKQKLSMIEKRKKALKIIDHWKGRKHSEESKTKMSIARIGRFKGTENPSWKGGVTPINLKIRRTVEYKLWRTAVFQRDNFICVWCGIKGVLLNADHIKPFAYFPELRFAIDNGRTLCVPCHKKTDTYGWKMQKNYKNNPLER